MRRLGEVLSQRMHQGDELYAAAVVAATNTTLQTQWARHQAQAQSFRRGEVTIAVAHSAIAGQIQQTENELRATINQQLAKQFPRLHQPISRLVTRPGLNP